MGAAGPASAALSMASMGLSAYGETLKAKGVAEGDIYKAEQLERAAEYGELKAAQTGDQMTRNLAVTLGHIDTIRAASRTDITSPTSQMARNTVEGVATEQKNITVDSLKAQAQEDEANAAYMRTAAAEAIKIGDVSALADILKGASGAVQSLGPPGGGGGGGGSATA